MTDMHCHILPGVDDGSSSWEESLAMARCALADGISHVICTPHMNAELDAPDRLAVCARIREELQHRLSAEGIALTLTDGAEWMLTPDLLDVVREHGRLGGSQAFLFELSPFMPPTLARELVAEARAAGLHPVMAHPERHPWLTEKNCAELQALIERGCMLQLTAGSLLGDFGRTVRRLAECLARMYPKAIVLASDAHGMRGRIPVVSGAYAALSALHDDLAPQARINLATVLRSMRTE